MTCTDRGTVRDKSYCKRQGGFCTSWRLLWCKRDIGFAIFISLAIVFFTYGIIYAWQNAEDRVDVLKKVEANRIAAEERMDELELKLEGYNKTMVGHWVWELKEWEKLSGKAKEGHNAD